MRIVANDWRDDWQVGNTVTAYKTTKPDGAAFHGSDVVYKVGKRVRPSAASLLVLRRHMYWEKGHIVQKHSYAQDRLFEGGLDDRLDPTPKPRDRVLCYPGLLHASPTEAGAVYYGKLMVGDSPLVRLFLVRGKIAVLEADIGSEYTAKAGFAQLEVLEDLGAYKLNEWTSSS